MISSEAHLLCIDVYTEAKRDWMTDYSCRQKASPYGIYYTITVSPDQKKEVLKKASVQHLKTRIYEARWERADDCRKRFFAAYSPPYRCRYCGRPLSAEYLQVDHVIPIARLKKSPAARNLLYIRGISEANDVRNLVPSCQKCNRKKGTHIGLWPLRAWLGKYPQWFLIRKIMRIIIIFILSAVLLRLAA